MQHSRKHLPALILGAVLALQASTVQAADANGRKLYLNGTNSYRVTLVGMTPKTTGSLTIQNAVFDSNKGLMPVEADAVSLVKAGDQTIIPGSKDGKKVVRFLQFTRGDGGYELDLRIAQVNPASPTDPAKDSQVTTFHVGSKRFEPKVVVSDLAPANSAVRIKDTSKLTENDLMIECD